MKQIHGYRKGECDPKEGRQLTICGRPIFQFDRSTIRIHEYSSTESDSHSRPQVHGRNKITCSTCLAKMVVTREAQRTNYITKHTG